MIPRTVTARRAATWARKTPSAFERGKDERALRIFIDDASLADDDLAASIVRGFVGHPLLKVFTTAPTADPRLEVERVDGEDGARVITTGSVANGVAFVSFASQKADLARRYAAQTTDVAELTRRILLVDHAELQGADAFVSSSPELLAMAGAGVYIGANIMSPPEAIALTGLFLRLRHDFAYLHSGASSASYGKDGFYALLARDLLPSSERWLTVCPQADPWQPSAFGLAQSALLRVERALYARDHIHEHLLQPQQLQGGDDVLFYLDAFLYSVAGAFDAIGRVVHAAFQIPGTPHLANWRGDRKKKKKKDPTQLSWTEELAVRAPAIADIMGMGKPHRYALDLIFILRNWVHAETLSSVPFVGDADRLDQMQHPLLLPPGDTSELLTAINSFGGAAVWGIRQIDTALYVMDVARFIENVLPRALAAMGAIMDLTPVDKLPGARSVSPRGVDERAKMAVQRIRFLSGLA